MVGCRLLSLASLGIILLGAVLAPAAVSGQDATAAQTFGTAAETAHVVTAAEFDTTQSSDGWGFGISLDPVSGTVSRGGGVGTAAWLAGLRLPAGAEITRVELAGCDFSTVGSLEFSLIRSKIPPTTGAEVVTPVFNTGGVQSPGCGRFSVSPSAPPLVIDNLNASYFLSVVTTGANFDSVRVFYRLAVSPAPATATFGDVPTSHTFFQYVEALVASGITAGCGGGNYCPDAPLTRGQMAVFLSKGLGLHFAP